MKKNKVGLVGIGKLGRAMMTHWNKKNREIGIYHPSKTKAEQFAEEFPNAYLLTEKDLLELDVLILALPAMKIIPFISDLDIKSAMIINMATILQTKEVRAKLPSLQVYGLKFMGHWKDLMEHGNGLFITETSLPKEIEELYQSLGKVKIENETCLTEINKLATYYAVKTAIEIENDFAKRGYSPEYIKRALISITPEVIRGYSDGCLGHFALEIVKEIKHKNEEGVNQAD